jgi:hypothetical protein
MTNKFYYFHAESGSLWCSNLSYEQEGNPDGCVEPITRKKAFNLAIELNKPFIPYYEDRKFIENIRVL